MEMSMADARTPTTPRERATTDAANPGASNAPAQIIKNAWIDEKATMSSDQPGTQQQFLSSSARTVQQTIGVKRSEFSGFGIRASGLAGVIVAGVLVVAWLALKYLH
jgi:hypothetical protein